MRKPTTLVAEYGHENAVPNQWECPMARQWYYARNKGRMGPVSSSELKQLADEGQLQPTDMVLLHGRRTWVPANTVKGLFPENHAEVPLPVTPVSLAPKQAPGIGDVINSKVSSAVDGLGKWIFAKAGALEKALSASPQPPVVGSEGDATAQDAAHVGANDSESKEVASAETYSDPMLDRKAEKVRFSQNKYRSSLPDSAQRALRPDEYVLADTYGPNQFYVVTTKRLLIGKIGLFGGIGQIVATVDLSKVTRIRTWSAL